MKKQIGFVSNVLDYDGHIQISFNENDFLLAIVHKLKGQYPTIKDLKNISGKTIQYTVIRENEALKTISIEID